MEKQSARAGRLMSASLMKGFFFFSYANNKQQQTKTKQKQTNKHHTRTHTHTPPSTHKILVLQVEGVQGVHEFHVWQLAGNRIVLSAHITCKMGEYMGVAAAVKKLFHNEGIHSTTIQPEFVEVSIVW